MNDATELWIIRHCQSYGNVRLPNEPEHLRDDYPLTPKGLRQAVALASRFEKGDVDAIYASTLQRTVQTIYPTAVKLDMRIKLVAELMEFTTKIPMTDPEPIARDYPRAFFRDLDGIDIANETEEDAVRRADKIYTEILAENEGARRIVIVTHGGFIGYLVRRALGLSLPEPFYWELENGGITAIELRRNDRPMLLFSNDRGHLRPDLL
ncbi:MAG: histidine phosphatase family protein [Clostridia bacterium]|nr:histidine phosphatase family protein [Clostridia bacterium]